MSRIFKQKETFKNPKLFIPDSPPEKLIYSENKPAKIFLKSGEVINGSCLNCPDTPCIKYKENELTSDTFPSFPQDIILNVCPTEAITLDADNGSPTIETNRCIACGICVSRCPIGAIYIQSIDTEEETDIFGVVNTDDEKYLVGIKGETEEEVAEVFNLNRTDLMSLERVGAFVEESEKKFQSIYNKVLTLKVDAQFPNVLTRNLLLQTGIPCAIRRKGDVNLRMDAVLGVPESNTGVVEIELAPIGILDSPRNTLDNIAVLGSRYNLNINTLTPLIVSLALPNSRTEYYRVINDIKNILNIKINTLTIGALYMLIWNNKQLALSEFDFYVDSENTSLRVSIEKILGRLINLPPGFNSIFETLK